ncbi:MAG: hypothetical protein LQ339_004181 [Xanthoria mediterranea]|nr:MAG: hypothetical protein LQ339_004181 [Xanthoria mediterranea]
MVVEIVLTGALVTVENAVWVVVVVKVVGVWAILVARWNLELSKKVKLMRRITQHGLTLAGCHGDKSLDVDLANYDYESAILWMMKDSEHSCTARDSRGESSTTLDGRDSVRVIKDGAVHPFGFGYLVDANCGRRGRSCSRLRGCLGKSGSASSGRRGNLMMTE